MKLIDYLKPLYAPQRQALASACDTTLGHLKNVGYGYRPCAAELAVRIERHTAGQVSRRDLRPDDWHLIWPELENSEEKQAPALTQQAQAATETVAQEAGHA